ncbi:MAG: sigma-70 family RNA polymerase sigma factor [Pirellulales bacterium]|nr:sigma-70 family RNA polymerase sigma factor [Pirellulales bacterium]
MRLRGHDHEAWQRLLHLYTPLVFSWCRDARIESQDAPDVVQDVFQAVARGIAAFRHSRPNDTFRGWLRTITDSKICDHFRHRAGRPVALGGTDAQLRFADLAADDSQGPASANPLAALVHRALALIRDEFEDSTWRAFWLTTIEEKSSSDAAEQLATTPGAVRQAKYKVMRRLRQELGDAE